MKDDLRQDQLVLQMIRVMNSILLQHNYDLKLTPYRALATSRDSGFIECVPHSKALAKIDDVIKYLKQFNTDDESFAKAQDAFVRSCGTFYCMLMLQLVIVSLHFYWALVIAIWIIC